MHDTVQVDAGEALRAGALRQQLEGGLQLRRLLRRVLAVRKAGVRAAGAPEPRLLPPVQGSVLLLLALKVRWVNVRIILHGCELLGFDAGKLRRMLQTAPAAVREI